MKFLKFSYHLFCFVGTTGKLMNKKNSLDTWKYHGCWQLRWSFLPCLCSSFTCIFSFFFLFLPIFIDHSCFYLRVTQTWFCLICNKRNKVCTNIFYCILLVFFFLSISSWRISMYCNIHPTCLFHLYHFMYIFSFTRISFFSRFLSSYY